MAQMHDGIQTALAPDPMGLGLGLLVTAVGVGLSVLGWWCVGAPIVGVGGLMLLNQVNGKKRTRLTFSKVLVEEERLVWGFLVGPTKRRIAWSDYAGVAVTDGEVVVKDKQGGDLRMGKGCPAEELEAFKARVEEAARRFEEEEAEEDAP